MPESPLDLRFARSPQPGLYRYATSFRKAGKSLGRYWDYYRVVRRSDDVRLTLNSTAFRAGDEVLAKIENDTPEWIFYGLPYQIQKNESGNWVPVDLSKLFGRLVAFLMIGLMAEPGTVAECSSGFTVPETMDPGWYQMVKTVDLRSDPRLQGRSRDVMAEFRVE